MQQSIVAINYIGPFGLAVKFRGLPQTKQELDCPVTVAQIFNLPYRRIQDRAVKELQSSRTSSPSARSKSAREQSDVSSIRFLWAQSPQRSTLWTLFPTIWTSRWTFASFSLQIRQSM